MKNIIYLLSLLSVFMCGLAAADCITDCVVNNRSGDQDCSLEKTPLTRCEKFSRYVVEDQQLNLRYKSLMKKLSAEESRMLRAAQRDWLAWRLEKCDEVDERHSCDNGVCAGVAHDSCIIDTTRQRTG